MPQLCSSFLCPLSISGPPFKSFPLRGPSPTTAPQSPTKMCALRRIVEFARQTSKARVTPSAKDSASLFANILRPAQRPALSDGELGELVTLVGNVSAMDLGLEKGGFIGPEISYIQVCETAEVAMGVFVLPPGGIIPLHDHVGMFVVSRVLWGRLEVREYDVMNEEFQGGKFAMTREVSLTEEGETRALTPTQGNIHSFQASEWTAVFDVLVPPYDPEQGRDCRYYEAIEMGAYEDGRGQRVLLEETSCPTWYRTTSVPYTGIQI